MRMGEHKKVASVECFTNVESEKGGEASDGSVGRKILSLKHGS